MALFLQLLQGYALSYIKNSAKIRSDSLLIKELREQKRQLADSNKTGEIQAISNNIDKLVEQQIWRKKEQETLLRGKLEETYEALDEDINILISAHTIAAQAGTGNAGNIPLPSEKAIMLLSLYFSPLLDAEINNNKKHRSALNDHVKKMNVENYYGSLSQSLDERLNYGGKLSNTATDAKVEAKRALTYNNA